MEDRSQDQEGETSPSVLRIAEAESQTPGDVTDLVPVQEVLDLFQEVFDLYLEVFDQYQEVPDLRQEAFDLYLEVLVQDWFQVERKVKEAEHWSVVREEEL